jgi:hypothetical protein
MPGCIHKGEVTHLPAHILKHLKVELPLRLRCLTAYTTIQELGASADRTRAAYVRQHGAFKSFQAVNVRLPPPPTAASTAASQFSLLGSMSPLVSTASTVPPSPYASQTAATPVHGPGIAGADGSNRHSIDDEVAALCKLSTPRAEAAMWALRAAQNAELQAARQAALAQAAQASAMTAIGGGGSAQRNASMETFGADRLASADSASSSTMSRAATQLLGGASVRPGSLTSTSGAEYASMGVESGNSHSKVRRVVGKDSPFPQASRRFRSTWLTLQPHRVHLESHSFRRSTPSAVTRAAAARNYTGPEVEAPVLKLAAVSVTLPQTMRYIAALG